jgi:hypothetical protein
MYMQALIVGACSKQRIYMPSNTDKIKKALEIRIKNHKGPGGKVPGSMNKKKTGYAKP